MAGYNHYFGMSNNAVTAYSQGVKPLSKFKAKDLQKAGLSISLAFAKWLALVDEWRSCEWHHSGGTWYNEVEFYSLEDLAHDIEHGYIDIQALEEKYKAELKAKKVVEEHRVSGSFPVWGGTRNHRKVVDTKHFTGTLRNGWIHLDGGGKKAALGNHIKWDFIDQPKED